MLCYGHLSYGHLQLIRHFLSEDTEAVITVWRAASDLAHPFLSKAFQDKAEILTRDIYLKMAEIWVHESDGQIDGFVGLLQMDTGWHIGGLFVHPDRHGQGIGRALVDKAVRLKGGLSVEVFLDNKIGRAFYAAYGFKGDVVITDPHSGHDLLCLEFIAN